MLGMYLPRRLDEHLLENWWKFHTYSPLSTRGDIIETSCLRSGGVDVGSRESGRLLDSWYSQNASNAFRRRAVGFMHISDCVSPLHARTHHSPFHNIPWATANCLDSRKYTKR